MSQGTLRLSCQNCSLFVAGSKAVLHLHVHGEAVPAVNHQRIYRCPFCNETSCDGQTLDEHLRDVHAPTAFRQELLDVRMQCGRANPTPPDHPYSYLAAFDPFATSNAAVAAGATVPAPGGSVSATTPDSTAVPLPTNKPQTTTAESEGILAPYCHFLYVEGYSSRPVNEDIDAEEGHTDVDEASTGSMTDQTSETASPTECMDGTEDARSLPSSPVAAVGCRATPFVPGEDAIGGSKMIGQAQVAAAAASEVAKATGSAPRGGLRGLDEEMRCGSDFHSDGAVPYDEGPELGFHRVCEICSAVGFHYDDCTYGGNAHLFG